jgi:uncharacterized protein YndB with AHSA1/START domain
VSARGRTGPGLRGLIIVGLALTSQVSPAAEISRVEVAHSDHRYTLSLEARIDAPPAAVFRVITDYDRIHRFHRSVQESRVLRRLDDHTAEVYTRVRGCVVVLFCRSIRRVERIVEMPPDRLLATVVPEQSDLTEGTVEWRLQPTEQGTLLRYDSVMDPDFWVPSVLGDSLLQSTIRRTTLEMIQRVEAEAQALPVAGAQP